MSVTSLEMQVEVVDGRWVVVVPWSDEPIVGDSWLEVWDEARRRRR